MTSSRQIWRPQHQTLRILPKSYVSLRTLSEGVAHRWHQEAELLDLEVLKLTVFYLIPNWTVLRVTLIIFVAARSNRLVPVLVKASLSKFPHLMGSSGGIHVGEERRGLIVLFSSQLFLSEQLMLAQNLFAQMYLVL